MTPDEEKKVDGLQIQITDLSERHLRHKHMGDVDQTQVLASSTRYILFKVLDSGTAHTVGMTFGGDLEMPIAGRITEIGAWVDTAGVTGTGTIDVNKNGATLMSGAKITLDTADKTSRTAAAPPALTTTNVAVGDIITVDIDAIQTTPAKGLTIRLGILQN